MNTFIKFAVNTSGCDKNWNFERLNSDFRDTEGTLADVIKHLKAGHAVCSGLLEERRREKANFAGSQWILVDIDNSQIWKDENGNPLDKDGIPVRIGNQAVDVNGNPIPKADREAAKIYKHDLTWDEAIAHPFVQKHCALIYTTASHTPSWHKFRMVFLLPELVTDIETYEAMVRLLLSHFPHDPACKDGVRVFYGSTKAEFPLVNPDAYLPMEWKEQAIAIAKKEREERQWAQLRAVERQQAYQSDSQELDTLIQSALSYIPPRQPGSGTYSESLKVAMALHSHYGDAAESIIEQWSPSIKGSTWNIGKKLKSFKRPGVGLGTLFFIAKTYGFEFPKDSWAEQEWGAPDPDEYKAFREWEEQQQLVDEEEGKQAILARILKVFTKGKQKTQPKTGFVPKQTLAASSEAVEEYQAGDRVDFWAGLINNGHRYILDQSPTGTGKSYDTGTARPEYFNAEKLIYATDQQRNPTVDTLLDEAGWAGLEARHDGLTPDGKGNLRRIKPGQEATVPGNCSRTKAIAVLRAKNVDGADEDIVCQTCPLLERCKYFSGAGYGHKDQRKRALMSDRIRSHPASLPEPGSFNYDEVVLIVDEAGQNFITSKIVYVHDTDLQKLAGTIAIKHPELLQPLHPILAGLTELLNAPKTPRYGFDKQAIAQKIGEIPAIDPDVLFDALGPDLSALDTPDELASMNSQEILQDKIDQLKQAYKKDVEELKRLEKLDLACAVHQISITEIDVAQGIDKEGIKAQYKAKRAIAKASFLDAVKELKAEYKREMKPISRTLRYETSQSSAETAQILEDSVLKQWLPDFLDVLNGYKGYLHINNGVLQITLPDDRAKSIVNAAKATIFLDATLTPEDLALKLGVDVSGIAVCRQAVPQHNNLDIIQVTDLGRMGMQRGADQQRRAEAIASHYKTIDSTTKVLDFKKFNGDGAWWRDSRGVNDFSDDQTLILTGTPCRNINSLLSEYAVLTGCQNQEDEGFKAYVDRAILADIHQAIGRIRANNRPGEKLTVVLLSDFELDIPTRKLNASDVTIEASGKFERFSIAAKAAIQQLKEQGQKITQTAVAAISGYSQQYVSRFWKLLLSLLENINSKSGKNLAPRDNPEIVSIIESTATTATPSQLLESIPEMFFEWLKEEEWQLVWRQLSVTAQQNIVAALLKVLPSSILEAIA